MDPTGIFDRLRAEWAVISGARYSFCIAVLIATGAVWLAVDSIYSTRLANEASIAALLQQQIDQLKAGLPVDQATSLPSKPSSSSLPASVAKGKVEVRGIPLDRLNGFFDNRTTAEARRLIEPYIGARVQISGTVENVSGKHGVPFGVSLSADRSFYLLFKVEAEKQISRLSIGDRVAADCEFDGLIAKDFISLADCSPLPLP